MRLSAEGKAHRRNQRGFSLLEAIIIVVVTLVLVALTGKSMLSARDNYNLTTATRQVASVVQLARTRAMSHDTRYKVVIDTTARVYRMEVCNKNSANTACDSWSPDATSGSVPLPPTVDFSITTPVSVTAPPPGSGTTVTQATEMAFNSRGLLFDITANAPTDTRCFYIQGNNKRPMAVCSTMVGQTNVFRLYNGNWQKQ